MKTRSLRLFVPMLLVFTLISCSNDSSEDLVTEDATLITNYDYSTDEIELARLINQYRVSTGKNELEIVNHISYKSQEHNFYMIQNNV